MRGYNTSFSWRERGAESSQGQLVYALPHPRRDGSTHLLLDPLELIEKLAVLMPEWGLLKAGPRDSGSNGAAPSE